jgi:hypothetical protein
MRAMAMPKYHSKTMNRDFDVVYFTGSIKINGKPTTGATTDPSALPANHPPVGGTSGQMPALPAGHPAIGGASGDTQQLPPGHPAIGGAPAAKPVDLTGIKQAEGGKTVSEIVTGKADLAGKDVAVRGKVVKYNRGVMAKNWLHIRDGSGSEGTNDLTITTSTETKVGDTVVAKGKVSINRDFGAGYKYDVILEDAQVTVE